MPCPHVRAPRELAPSSALWGSHALTQALGITAHDKPRAFEYAALGRAKIPSCQHVARLTSPDAASAAVSLERSQKAELPAHERSRTEPRVRLYIDAGGRSIDGFSSIPQRGHIDTLAQSRSFVRGDLVMLSTLNRRAPAAELARWRLKIHGGEDRFYA